MTSNIAIGNQSYFPGPLYVLFVSTSIEIFREMMRKRIPEDSTVLVFDVEGTLFSYKNPVFELERVEARELYKKHTSVNSPPTLASAYIKHLSVPKLFAEECNIPPNEYFEFKSKLRYDGYLQIDEVLKLRLKQLKDKGYRLVVWSNNDYTITNRVLSLLMIENVFDVVFYYSGDTNECFLQKPLKEANYLLFKLLGVNKRDQIYVFDQSLATVDSSRKSGFNGAYVDRREGLIVALEDFIVSGDLYDNIHINDGNIEMPYGINDIRKEKKSQ